MHLFCAVDDLLSNSNIADIDCPIIIRNEAANNYFIADCNSLVEKLMKDAPRYHSTILEDIPVKLFIDLDNVDGELTYGVAHRIAYSVIMLTGVECEVLITKASNKESYHIHFSDFHFSTIYHIKEWVTNVLIPNVDEDVRKFIDTAQYRRYGGIRCLWATKIEKDAAVNRKIPCNYFNHLLENLPIEEETKYKLTKMSLVTLIEDEDQTEIEVELCGREMPRIAAAVETSRLLEAANIVCGANKGLMVSKQTSYNSITLFRVSRSMCRVCGRQHDRNNSYLQQYKNGAVYMGCYAADKDKKMVMILGPPEVAVPAEGYPARDENIKDFLDLVSKYNRKKFDAKMLLQFAADARGIIGKQCSIKGTLIENAEEIMEHTTLKYIILLLILLSNG